jgi:DNA-binding MarR family transcriptional regulator
MIMPSQVADAEATEVAQALWVSVSLLRRRLRQMQADGTLKAQETSALARLEAGGPTTASALARIEQITPQSMGTTISALEERGLVARRADASDGRLSVISITKEGLVVLRGQQGSAIDQLAQALTDKFSRTELKRLAAAAPLIERLAHIA